MERKILVAVDGSHHSYNILRYLGMLFENVKSFHIHLFYLVSGASLPETGAIWLDEHDPVSGMNEEGRKQYHAAQRYMGEAILQLSRRGIDPEHIATSVRVSGLNTADEILLEARKGMYDALVMGRRGLGVLEKIFMGSVSTSILEKCRDIPIWMIDGAVHSAKILMPVDGTIHSLRAADHLAFILHDNPHAEITLFHSSAMLAGRGVIDPEELQGQWGKEWCELHLSRPDSLFHAPEQILRESGFPEDRLHRLHTRRGIYPSRQILRQAIVDDFGTIAMGRRGTDAQAGIFSRRVSDQIIAMAEGMAVWVVG
jgi:nucleotide-binding universal stress UspA family protein